MLAVAERAWKGGGTEYLTRTAQYFLLTDSRSYSRILLILNVVCCGIRNTPLPVIRLRMSVRQM